MRFTISHRLVAVHKTLTDSEHSLEQLSNLAAKVSSLTSRSPHGPSKLRKTESVVGVVRNWGESRLVNDCRDRVESYRWGRALVSDYDRYWEFQLSD